MANIEWSNDLDLGELHQRVTSEAHVSEANQFRTLPTGAYRLIADKVEVRRADERAPNPGRLEARIQATAESTKADPPQRGKVFFTVSPEVYYRDTSNGRKMDSSAKLWGQAVKAWGMQASPIAEVFEAFGKYSLDSFVTETFKTAEGAYTTPRTPDERRRLVDEGAEPNNFVVNVSKVKDSA